ncbi:MAG TPA: Shedu immune nuclease family protein [Streptosporangiaceae bacterium]|nr:Shedu immune nuclease family protein [Streptosporangiaceae bacterium]
MLGTLSRVTRPSSSALDSGFRDPFTGHLPGYLAENERTSPGLPDPDMYNRFLMEHWQALLDSDDSRDERLLQGFLERHPSLLPGPYSVDGDSGHSAFPLAVISKPKLPGLSDREPDFMWLASDSGSLYPVLIEIETPHKAWFYGDRAEIHSDFTHAYGQLAEWRAWFGRGYNRTAFLEYYDVPPMLARRQLAPRYVLIHGRRENFESVSRRREKRAELARPDERLMSFDRLTPAKNSVLFSAVRKGQDGYRVVSVPPSLTLFNTGSQYQLVSGWEAALDGCPDMAAGRRDYLKEQLDLLTRNPDAYVTTTGTFRTRRPRWL